jgi:hypothetical protein
MTQFIRIELPRAPNYEAAGSTRLESRILDAKNALRGQPGALKPGGEGSSVRCSSLAAKSIDERADL